MMKISAFPSSLTAAYETDSFVSNTNPRNVWCHQRVKVWHGLRVMANETNTRLDRFYNRVSRRKELSEGVHNLLIICSQLPVWCNQVTHVTCLRIVISARHNDTRHIKLCRLSRTNPKESGKAEEHVLLRSPRADKRRAHLFHVLPRHRSFPGAMKNCAGKFLRVGWSSRLFAAKCKRKAKCLATLTRARRYRKNDARPADVSVKKPGTSRRREVSPGKLREKRRRATWYSCFSACYSSGSTLVRTPSLSPKLLSARALSLVT